MAKRRAPGEGSVYRRADGRWEARRTVGVTAAGHPRRVSGYGRTKAEAIRARDVKIERLGGMEAAGRRRPKDVTVRRWLEDWLTYRGTSVRPGTLESYRQVVRDYLVPDLGTVRLQDLGHERISRAMTGLLSRTDDDGNDTSVSARTARYALGLLRSALDYAVRCGRLQGNPAAGVRVDGGRQRRVEAWEPEEVRRFLAAAASASSPWARLYELALTIGARRGELIGLRVDDLDLDEGRTIWIRRSISMRGDITPGKTSAARRRIQIDLSTVQLLREQLAHRAEIEDAGIQAGRWEDTGTLWPTRRGRPVMARNLIRDYTAVVASCDPPVRPIPFHGLRHTYATLALQAGVPLLTVSHRIGHSRPDETMRVYAHVLRDLQQAGALSLEQLLAGRN